MSYFLYFLFSSFCFIFNLFSFFFSESWDLEVNLRLFSASWLWMRTAPFIQNTLSVRGANNYHSPVGIIITRMTIVLATRFTLNCE